MAQTMALEDRAKKITDEVLTCDFDSEDFETKEFEAKLDEAIALYDEIIANNPENIEAHFNRAYLSAYKCKDVAAKHKGALELLSTTVSLCVDALPNITQPIEEKQEFISDITVKIDKIVADFIKQESLANRLAVGLAMFAMDTNKNSNSWGFEPFVDSFWGDFSTEVVEQSLSLMGNIISAIGKTNVENRYACTAHLAKRAVYEAVHAPAFAYDETFYKKYSGMLEAAIKVVKSSSPHEIYYIPEPDYARVSNNDVIDYLKSHYKSSSLRKFIMKENELAETEAIQRYWKNNPGRKEALEAEKNSLEKERADCNALCNENRRIIQEAAATRDRTLVPGKKKIADTERELKGLETELSGLNIFQGKRKKEIRSIIETKTAELTEAKKACELLKKDAEASYTAAIAPSQKVVIDCEKKLKTAEKRLKEIGKKLENPLDN